MARISLFHPAFQTPGGAELLCLRQAQVVAQEGHRTDLVTMKYDPEIWGPKLDGMRVRVAKYRGNTDAFVFYSKRLKQQMRGRRACKFMRRSDVAVAHNYPCNTMLGQAVRPKRRVWQCNEPPRRLHARLANPRLTGHAEAFEGEPTDLVTGLWQVAIADQDRYYGSEKREARLAHYDIEMTQQLDYVYAISEFSRDNVKAIYGRCGDEVVYPIVEFPEPVTRRSGRDRADGLHVLIHTRLEMHKNVDAAIRGFAAFHRSQPNAHLHIVGNGPLREDLEAIAAQALPPEAYRFHGYLPQAELDEVYARCTVFVLLTLDEPFGLVYPEAAARGLLLIGSDHGGPLEIIDDGQLGHCVDPFAAEALVAALEECSAYSDEELDRRREKADLACRSRYSREAVLPLLLDAWLKHEG